MAGISSSALIGARYAENRMKYNGKELQNKEFGGGSGLEWYDYGARMQDPQIGRWHVIDSMSERYYESAPYVYVLNNPIRRIDIKGYTDWDAILKGMATTVSGVVGTVVGGAAIISPILGIGQVGGAALVSTSIPAAGLGIGMVIAGIKDNNSAGNIPGGVFEASGMAVDAAMGNDKPVARNAGSVTDLGVSVALGGVPTNARDAVVTTTLAVYTANDIYNMATGSNTSVSTKVGNTIKSVLPQSGTGSGAAPNVNTGRTDQNGAGTKKPETPNFLDPTFKGFLR